MPRVATILGMLKPLRDNSGGGTLQSTRKTIRWRISGGACNYLHLGYKKLTMAVGPRGIILLGERALSRPMV